jgi:thioredoxin reductase
MTPASIGGLKGKMSTVHQTSTETRHRRRRVRGADHGRLLARRSATPRPPAFDAVIVGGGPAGLSAALVLGRSRRRVLVVDSGRPANAPAEQIGGLLAQSTVSPAELRRDGRDQLAEHANVRIRDDAVSGAERIGGEFAITLADGGAVRARALVLAHGLRYDPPALAGIEALWGRSVFHCPFCDGWEVRDRPLAVHGNGHAAAGSAIVIAGWSSDVVLCTDGPARLNGERAVLEAAGVRIREQPIRHLAGADGRLRRIEFDSGPPEMRDALFVRTVREQPNGLATELGCELGPGGTILTDEDGRTGVSGVFAAGDAATDHSRSVANAIGTGSRVAYALALDLVTELA